MTAPKIIFTIHAEVDDTPVRGNASASGDVMFDANYENSIIRELNDGNSWAWCTVIVTAKFGTFEGTASLGCCSYASEDDFKAGGYYDDLRNDALDDLNHHIDAAKKELQAFDMAYGDAVMTIHADRRARVIDSPTDDPQAV